MEFTKGEMLYYGGWAGIVVLLLISIVLYGVFRYRKKKLIRKINEEY